MEHSVVIQHHAVGKVGKSYTFTVAVDGGEPWILRPTIRMRSGGQERRDWTEMQLNRTERQPTGTDRAREVCWTAFWEEVRAEWDKEHNSSRTTGLAAAREHSSRWNGTVPLAELSRYGFSSVGNLEEGLEDEFKLLDAVLARVPSTGRTHQAAYETSSETVYFEYPPGNKKEKGCVQLKGAEAAALTAIVERAKESVGKEGVVVMVEGLRSRAHPGGGVEKKPLTSAPPPWHGDHREMTSLHGEEPVEYAEVTRPNLAITMGTSKRYVPTLFPDREHFMSTSPGTGLKAVGEAEEEELEVENYFEAREARWRLVWKDGRNGGVGVLATSATGASEGLTDGGKAAAIPKGAEQFHKNLAGERAYAKRGDCVAFDATGPHRGPGMTKAEVSAVGQRRVLYISFAAESRQMSGSAPTFAFAPERAKTGKPRAVEGVHFHLAFDERGNFLLGSRPPGRSPKKGKAASSSKRPREPREVSRERLRALRKKVKEEKEGKEEEEGMEEEEEGEESAMPTEEQVLEAVEVEEETRSEAAETAAVEGLCAISSDDGDRCLG